MVSEGFELAQVFCVLTKKFGIWLSPQNVRINRLPHTFKILVGGSNWRFSSRYAKICGELMIYTSLNFWYNRWFAHFVCKMCTPNFCECFCSPTRHTYTFKVTQIRRMLKSRDEIKMVMKRLRVRVEMNPFAPSKP